MQGTVKWFNRVKGYGFIQGEDAKEYFVHFTSIPKGTFIRDNDLVSFDPSETDKGLQAQNIQLIQKGSEREGAAPAGNGNAAASSDEEPESDSEDFGDETQE